MAGVPLEDDRMCFCCGERNPIGLKLAFETTPDGRLNTLWRPKREHVGFKDLIHGGLVATVLDEVMARVIYERGTPGVTAVLVGMRKAEYVRDALGVLAWPPLGDVLPLYRRALEVRPRS